MVTSTLSLFIFICQRRIINPEDVVLGFRLIWTKERGGISIGDCELSYSTATRTHRTIDTPKAILFERTTVAYKSLFVVVQ